MKTLFDNYDPQEQYDYSSYLEWCEDNGIEPKGADSNDYSEYANDSINIDWDDLIENLKCYDIYHDRSWVVSGSLGLWNGPRRICSEVSESLTELILKCVSGCDYFRIEYDDLCVYVTASHHDGTNNFEIRMLSRCGESRWVCQNSKFDYDDRRNYKRLPEYFF